MENIELLRDIPDLLPVRRDYFDNRNIRIFDRKELICKNYLSPNRRGFYKIIFIDEGRGIFTIGTNTYPIEEPTLLFIHPNDIISWKNLSINKVTSGYFCIVKRSFTDKNSLLKALMNKYGLFNDTSRSVIPLPGETIKNMNGIFLQMYKEEKSDAEFAEDALQVYMQLIMVEASKIASYSKSTAISLAYRKVHDFFQLLEKETANINYEKSIEIKTAKQFADQLNIHPNHLNALLKKQTGQNVSAHIRNRLLEESKILLIQTDWTLQNIGYAIGFTEQPSFSHFFKKNIGITPAEFRRSYNL
ncbi:AraC-like ligand binding domain-containing protein [Pedobacter westerhofensis]|uniref:AraC-like ligand binding domain-containing protein n=1 Tax=Pedobacter westerhofensis TaxID=425512 RepID=A0A521F6L9_9SPHI|nr:helix-turn-helix domain-containing protein [Pedobacter westerhofensis]SMO91261.1 AraC-like ligand binding domain-containing protein [Pedobacter westerhofensis]